MNRYKCCCCIPIRAGVLIIALLTAAVYIALTVLQFIGGPSSGVNVSGSPVDLSVLRGVHYTTIAIYIIVALASLFGVIGCIAQQRQMVAFFKVAYWTVTILEFLASIAIIIVLAVQRGVILDACTEAYPTEASDTCSVAFRNAMIIFSVIVVIVNFFQFYFAVVISAYADRLKRTHIHEKLRNMDDFPEPPSKEEFF